MARLCAAAIFSRLSFAWRLALAFPMTPDDSSSGLPTCSVRADGLFTQPQVWVDQEQGDQQTNQLDAPKGSNRLTSPPEPEHPIAP